MEHLITVRCHCSTLRILSPDVMVFAIIVSRMFRVWKPPFMQWTVFEPLGNPFRTHH